MKFMITWKMHPEMLHETLAKFAKTSKRAIVPLSPR
jgi:hypothetical protein